MRSDALAAILGMALVTSATRLGGLWLLGRIRPSPRLEAWLRQIPGAILVALVAPTALNGGLAEALATLVAILVAARTGGVVPALIAGTGTVWLLRALGG